VKDRLPTAFAEPVQTVLLELAFDDHDFEGGKICSIPFANWQVRVAVK
jgi:hypothetical protein